MDLFKTWIVETPIAHRGLHSKGVPENSLSAFSKAIEKGFAIELDVQLLADKTVVVFHDESLARMTENDGYIKSLNKSDLKALTLKDSKEKIPTLEDVLKLVDGKVPLLVEIKNEHKVGELEQAVIDTLKNYKGEFAVQSFNPHSLAYFKEHAPNVLRGQLGEVTKSSKIGFLARIARKRLSNTNISQPNFISYNVKDLPNRYVNKHKDLPLIAWTVTSKSDYLSVVKKCDNVIFEDFEPEI